MRKASYIIVLTLVLAGGLSAHSQVVVEGNVSHDNKPISDVKIQVLENEKVVRTVAANKRGRFEVHLPINHYFKLVFNKAFMFPIILDVNTFVNRRDIDEIVIPLNMELVYRYDSIKTKAVAESIGIVKQLGRKEETFGFIANQDVMDRLKALNEVSYRLEEMGYTPTMETVKVDSAVDEINNRKDLRVAVPSDDSVINIAEKSDIENALKTNAVLSRNSLVSKAMEVKVESKRLDMVNAETSSNIQANSARKHIYSEKKVSAQRQQDDAAHKNELANSVAHKGALVSFDYERAARNDLVPGKSYRPPVLEDNPGWFVSKQKLIVDSKLGRDTYEMVTYHIVFTDITYYYKNSNEISAEEYEAILFSVKR